LTQFSDIAAKEYVAVGLFLLLRTHHGIKS